MANARPHDAPLPQKAIDFLAKKIRVETDKWDDLKRGGHARAFTVAHSSGAGVLDGIHRLLNKAVEDGVSFQEFRNGMLDNMKKSGWYGGAGHTKDEKKSGTSTGASALFTTQICGRLTPRRITASSLKARICALFGCTSPSLPGITADRSILNCTAGRSAMTILSGTRITRPTAGGASAM
jgi:hypothetical protein